MPLDLLLEAIIGGVLLGCFYAAVSMGLSVAFGLLDVPHHKAKAKHIIYLFQNGAPTHVDLFDYKPKLKQWHGKEIPAEIQMGKRLSTMTSGQKSFPCVAPMFSFARHGQSGAYVSELLPHMASVIQRMRLVSTRLKACRSAAKNITATTLQPRYPKIRPNCPKMLPVILSRNAPGPTPARPRSRCRIQPASGRPNPSSTE